MPQLAQLIADHEARTQPTETPVAAVLTPRGHGLLAIVRLRYLLTELEGADRAYCLKLLRDLVTDAATA